MLRFLAAMGGLVRRLSGLGGDAVANAADAATDQRDAREQREAIERSVANAADQHG